jgi:hypothetical protein
MTAALAPGQRLGRLEDPCRDLPFYNGAPMGLTGGQWLFVMAAVAAGFAVLIAPIPWPAGPLGAMIPAVLFPLMPLAALARAVPDHWKALFGRVGTRFAYGRALYQARLTGVPFFEGVYGGLAYEMAHMPQAIATSNRSSFQSGTAYVAADTPLGVAYLGVGHANQGTTAVYIYLGKPF